MLRKNPYHAVAAFLLLVYIVSASIYSVVNPIWEAPDELGHYAYVVEIARDHRLPLQEKGGPGEAHQPPLYYLVTALAVLPANLYDLTGAFEFNRFMQNAGMGGSDKNFSLHGSVETFPYQGLALGFHLARLVSVLMGAGTVGLTIAIGWLIFSKQRSIGLLAGAFVAFNPQFLFISSAINNDNLVNLAGAAIILHMLLAWRKPESTGQWALAGVWLAVGTLSKLNVIPFFGIVFIILTISAIRRRSIRLMIQNGALILAIVAIVCGWWFVRNQVLYGDLLGWQVFSQIFAWAFRTAPLGWSDIQQFLPYEFRSFWALFGWINISAPEWFYLGVGLISVAGCLGLVKWITQRLREQQRDDTTKGIGLLVFAVVLQEAYQFVDISRFNETHYQGRYLFSVIAPIMILLSLGLHELIPERIRSRALSSLAGALCLVALFMPFGVIQPAFHFVPAPKWTLWFVPHPLDLTFGNMLELKGYSTDVVETNGASSIKLVMYWRAAQKIDFDYSTFAHVLDAGGQVIAQQDQAPGQDRHFPPTNWRPGDIIVDTRVIPLPAGVKGDLRLRVGAYNYLSGVRLPMTDHGVPANDFIVFSEPIQVR